MSRSLVTMAKVTSVWCGYYWIIGYINRHIHMLCMVTPLLIVNPLGFTTSCSPSVSPLGVHCQSCYPCMPERNYVQPRRSSSNTGSLWCFFMLKWKLLTPMLIPSLFDRSDSIRHHGCHDQIWLIYVHRTLYVSDNSLTRHMPSSVPYCRGVYLAFVW